MRSGNGKRPSSSKTRFIRSSQVVWLIEFVIVALIGIAIYNDWDLPLRNRIFPIDDFGFERFPELRSNYVARMKLSYFAVVALITMLVASLVSWGCERQELYERIASLADNHAPMRAEDFLIMRDRLVVSKTLSSTEFTGVYILHNLTKEKYYVGQSVRVLSRINQHLTGHGNGDVYADFKYGDDFTVSTIPMMGSGYQSLNDLERDAIAAYDAVDHGYNMTHGNRR